MSQVMETLVNRDPHRHGPGRRPVGEPTAGGLLSPPGPRPRCQPVTRPAPPGLRAMARDRSRRVRNPGCAPGWERRQAAACLAAGPGAVLSHRAVAALHGFPDCWQGAPEITAPWTIATPPRARSYPPGHRPGVDRRDRRKGIPVTERLRTVLDLAAVVSPPTLAAILDDLVAARALALAFALAEVITAAGVYARRGRREAPPCARFSLSAGRAMCRPRASSSAGFSPSCGWAACLLPSASTLSPPWPAAVGWTSPTRAGGCSSRATVGAGTPIRQAPRQTAQGTTRRRPLGGARCASAGTTCSPAPIGCAR